MRWEDERYVRLYTRDTVDWLALSWHAQALLMQLLRKVDRAGILPLGKRGPAALAILLGRPEMGAQMEAAFAELVADGCLLLEGEQVVFRNFIEAQETQQTDKARKRSQRERDRDKASGSGFKGSAAGADIVAAKDREVSRGHGLGHAVTDSVTLAVTSGHAVTEPVTRGHAASHAVTDGHAVTEMVTPCCAVPSRAEPCRTEPEKEAPRVRVSSLRQGMDPSGVVAQVEALYRAATGQEFSWGLPNGPEERAVRALEAQHGETLPALLAAAFDPSWPQYGSLAKLLRGGAEAVNELRAKAAKLRAKAGEGRAVTPTASFPACTACGGPNDFGAVWDVPLCVAHGPQAIAANLTSEAAVRAWLAKEAA